MARETWIPLNIEDRALVGAALEEILSSALFRSSRRYPAMLRYIVEKTLEGQQDFLKERTIGVEVFGRDPGYDTNLDPVVRFSAGEVRKRIAQYYREQEKNGPIEIELPLGTYVPRFHRPANQTGLAEDFRNDKTPETDKATKEEIPQIIADHDSPRSFRRGFYVLAVLLLASLIGTYIYVRRQAQDPVELVWDPLLTSTEPVLISAGRPHLDQEPTPSPTISIQNHILQPEFRVSFTTVSAIARIVGFLQVHNKAFHIREAYSHNLADLHDRPIVLVNANDNKWTLLLLKPLRFRFESQGPLSYIIDSQNPANHNWFVNFDQPYLEQTADYAIVASFHSETTGGPVIVVAGISSNGTEAAGEFIVSPDALRQLKKLAPPGWKNGNFEAVLKVEVVSGNTGATSIAASQFW